MRPSEKKTETQFVINFLTFHFALNEIETIPVSLINCPFLSRLL